MESIIPTEDTIAAIASAIKLGEGGVAVIRVSGNKSINCCKNIVKTKSKDAWESHKVFHGYIKENVKGKLIDEILIIVMKGPNSFTGEDVVELHCHGGIIIVKRVLSILLENPKIRIANPGEFSQRAFLNGKIDLTQAEAINQLISAKNIRSAELAFKGLQGEVNKKISFIKNLLIEQLAEIEARVDFEEDFEEFNYSKFQANLKKIKQKIEILIHNSKNNSYLENGITIGLIGQTNVGKSSLLNLLSKKNKAIVTDIPGTTRDTIEVSLIIEDIPFRIVDTAGIRKTEDKIERLGIDKSIDMIKEADFIIYVYDLTKGLDSYDKSIIKDIPQKKLLTLLGNKLDLIENNILKKNINYKNSIFMSIAKNIGEEDLIKKIIKKCAYKRSDDLEVILNERQISNLKNSLDNLYATDEIINHQLPFDLLSIELRESLKNLSKLTGQELTEDLLNNIFSKFCIGK